MRLFCCMDIRCYLKLRDGPSMLCPAWVYITVMPTLCTSIGMLVAYIVSGLLLKSYQVILLGISLSGWQCFWVVYELSDFAMQGASWTQWSKHRAWYAFEILYRLWLIFDTRTMEVYYGIAGIDSIFTFLGMYMLPESSICKHHINVGTRSLLYDTWHLIQQRPRC